MRIPYFRKNLATTESVAEERCTHRTPQPGPQTIIPEANHPCDLDGLGSGRAHAGAASNPTTPDVSACSTPLPSVPGAPAAEDDGDGPPAASAVVPVPGPKPPPAPPNRTPILMVDGAASPVLGLKGTQSQTTKHENDVRGGKMNTGGKKPAKAEGKEDIISMYKLMKAIPDEAAAVAYLENWRWGKGLYCPRCGSRDARVHSSGKPMSHWCSSCRRYFSVRTGTVMAQSHLPLRKWITAIYLLLCNRKGVSATQIAKQIGVTKGAAWFLMHRIREAMQHDGEWLTGTVEEGESCPDGKEDKNHGNERNRSHDAAWAAKIPVVGFKQRDGKIVAFPIEKASIETMESTVLGHVSNKEHANPDDPEIGTLSIESFWSLMKRGYMGVYHHWSREHIHRYCNEFVYRKTVGFSNGFRAINDVLARMEGKRLTRKMLVSEGVRANKMRKLAEAGEAPSQQEGTPDRSAARRKANDEIKRI